MKAIIRDNTGVIWAALDDLTPLFPLETIDGIRNGNLVKEIEFVPTDTQNHPFFPTKIGEIFVP
jgi:hypothetical protein